MAQGQDMPCNAYFHEEKMSFTGLTAPVTMRGFSEAGSLSGCLTQVLSMLWVPFDGAANGWLASWRSLT